MFGLLLLLVSCSNDNTFFFCQAQQQQMQNQQQQIQQQQQQIQQQLKMYENAVIQNPTDAELLYMLGWFLLAAIGDDVPLAIQILQDCFNSTIVELTLDKYTGTAEYSKIYLASSFLGQYLNERSDHFIGKK
jgi:ribulose kinase